ncbi:MAG TPA: glutaredoxin 3 [Gammaproteobacteria bacterium]|nr:glutaredoxin 3 [Gammaproteobacteria bacterium]
MQSKIIIYTKANCPYCVFAKDLLDTKKVRYHEIRVDLDDNERVIMEQKSGRRSVPQIFINDQPIGGFDDLSALEKAGTLNHLLFTKGT